MTPETTMRTGSQKGRKRVFHVFICTRDWKLRCYSTSRSQRDIWRLQATKEAQQSIDRRGDGLLPVPRHVWLWFQRPQWSTGRFFFFFLLLAFNRRTRIVTFLNISSSTTELICSSITRESLADYNGIMWQSSECPSKKKRKKSAFTSCFSLESARHRRDGYHFQGSVAYIRWKWSCVDFTWNVALYQHRCNWKVLFLVISTIAQPGRTHWRLTTEAGIISEWNLVWNQQLELNVWNMGVKLEYTMEQNFEIGIHFADIHWYLLKKYFPPDRNGEHFHMDLDGFCFNTAFNNEHAKLNTIYSIVSYCRHRKSNLIKNN